MVSSTMFAMSRHRGPARASRDPTAHAPPLIVALRVDVTSSLQAPGTPPDRWRPARASTTKRDRAGGVRRITDPDLASGHVVQIDRDSAVGSRTVCNAGSHPNEIGRASCRERVCQYV